MDNDTPAKQYFSSSAIFTRMFGILFIHILIFLAVRKLEFKKRMESLTNEIKISH